KEGKWNAVVKEISGRHESGQPVLVGTISVEVSQLLSERLKQGGIEHTVLNAKPEHAAREADIVAEAGQPGAVTIATNMAGRGVVGILARAASSSQPRTISYGFSRVIASTASSIASVASTRRATRNRSRRACSPIRSRKPKRRSRNRTS